MRTILVSGVVFWASLSMVSCGKAESPVSTVKSSRGFSCDLQSSAAASSDASKGAFKCAYNSLKAAGKLAGGGIVTDIANIVDGSKSVYEGSRAAVSIFRDLSEYVSNNGNKPLDVEDTPKDLQTTFESGKKIFEQTEAGKKLKKDAMYSCLDGNYRAVKDLVSLAKMSSSLGGSSGSSTLTVTEVRSLGKFGYTGLKALLDRMRTLSECSRWLQGTGTENLLKLSEGIKKITTSLEVVASLASCGVDLAYGGYVLANNSACLVEDINNYYSSIERLENSKNNLIHNPGFKPLSEEDGRVVGNDGSYSRCMSIYGIWLSRQTYVSYLTRSGVCADQCASANGRDTYYTKSRQIFPRADDYGYCLMNQKIPGSLFQVEACISHCCQQNGSCADAALRKAGYY